MKQNCIYMMVFEHRKNNGQIPHSYIGSKTNMYYDNFIIYDKKNKPYYSSSKSKLFKDAIKTEIPKMYILEYVDDVSKLMSLERYYQVMYNVKKSTEFFNLEYAAENNFSRSDYATYKHHISEKIVRLPLTDPDVLNGIYVGVTKGNILTDEHKSKIGLVGVKNPFYGKKHKPETIELLRKNATGVKKSAETLLKISKSQRGRVKTQEHRKKIGRKGFILLKEDTQTGNVVRIEKGNVDNYLNNGYIHMNTWLLKYNPKIITCPYCNKSAKESLVFRRWHFKNCRNKDEN